MYRLEVLTLWLTSHESWRSMGYRLASQYSSAFCLATVSYIQCVIILSWSYNCYIILIIKFVRNQMQNEATKYYRNKQLKRKTNLANEQANRWPEVFSDSTLNSVQRHQSWCTWTVWIAGQLLIIYCSLTYLKCSAYRINRSHIVTTVNYSLTVKPIFNMLHN